MKVDYFTMPYKHCYFRKNRFVCTGASLVQFLLFTVHANILVFCRKCHNANTASKKVRRCYCSNKSSFCCG